MPWRNTTESSAGVRESAQREGVETDERRHTPCRELRAKEDEMQESWRCACEACGSECVQKSFEFIEGTQTFTRARTSSKIVSEAQAFARVDLGVG